MSSNETLLQNDADGVECIILQLVTELCVSKDRDKKLAAEVLPNSVPEHKEIANSTTEAMPISVPQQREIIDEVAETIPNSVAEQGGFINEVSTTNIDICGVTVGNNVETTNVTNNYGRAFLDRFKEFHKRYKAICASQQAIEIELIDSCEDYEVYNKKGADGKIKIT